MRRTIEKELIEWKEDQHRLPLLLRGARQVGKSYVLEKFGHEHFSNVVVVNLEMQTGVEKCFEDLDPKAVIERLELRFNVRIIEGETLLILDEIQACPRAIVALRYFKERLPGLHVIGAGSLLEFVLEGEKFSFPVGRVQFLHLGPLSFCEFLQALSEERLLEGEGSAIHERTLELVRIYLLLGGMPAVVAEYIRSGSLQRARQLQGAILTSYKSDFGKYASKAQGKYLQRLFERAPQLVGHHFRYSKVDSTLRARELAVALEQLCHAGLVRRIHATGANGLPLRAEINLRKFKLLFLDIGLLQAANQVEPDDVLLQGIQAVNSGELAEQFVGQELLAYANPYEERHLFFWERSKTGSSAEIDYVVRVDSRIVPIEVKAGATGRLRSLKQFLAEKRIPLGVRISEQPMSRDHNILSIPFYLISKLPQLLEQS